MKSLHLGYTVGTWVRLRIMQADDHLTGRQRDELRECNGCHDKQHRNLIDSCLRFSSASRRRADPTARTTKSHGRFPWSAAPTAVLREEIILVVVTENVVDEIRRLEPFGLVRGFATT